MINPRKALRQAQALAKRNADLSGTGTYLFANNTRGDYTLPRPTKEGVRQVKKDGQFVGDSYYFGLLKSGDIRLVKEIKEEVVAAPAPAGEKEYVFQNRFREDLHLPHASKEGLVIVPPLGEFTGDERYFSLMREGRVKLVKEVNAMENKLMTEQPPTVTHQGKVEYVVDDNGQQLTEQKKKEQEKLLAEKTLEGVKLLLD